MSLAVNILRTHAEEQALIQIYKAKLDQLMGQPKPTQAEINEYIENESTKRPALDDILVKSRTQTSRTERIAMRYEDNLIRAHDEEIAHLSQEIARLQYRAALYDAMLKRLHEHDRWLILEKYVKERALAQIINEMPSEIGIYSKATLSRRLKKIITSLDAMLEKCA